jgi:hypothetical protein
MVMVLFRGMCRPDPQYLAVSVREAKWAHLWYGTRLSRIHTLDPPLALAFPRSIHSATPDPEQENNQGTSLGANCPVGRRPVLFLAVRRVRTI